MANRICHVKDRSIREDKLYPIGRLYANKMDEIVQVVSISGDVYQANCPKGTWGGRKIDASDLREHWKELDQEEYNRRSLSPRPTLASFLRWRKS